MNTERTEWLKGMIALYESKKKTAAYPNHYDNAINLYKQELNNEFKNG